MVLYRNIVGRGLGLYIEQVTDAERSTLTQQFLQIDPEELENPRQFFQYIGTLDVFDHCLSEDEARKLLDYPNHNLRHESKYITFFNQVFDLNGSKPIFVNLQLSFAYPALTPKDKARMNTALKALDKVDSKLFSILLKTYTSVVQNGLFKVYDQEALRLLVTLSARESCFSNFFFDNLNTVIIGNYDLSFPVYCTNESSFQLISNTAQDYSLFVRIA